MTLSPQIKQLIRLIECHRPIRIVSLHGIHRSDNDAKTPEAGDPKAGIFVDPRYSIPKDKRKTANYDLEGFKFDTSRDPGYPPVKDKDGNPIAKQYNSAWTPQGRDDDAFALRFAKAVGDPSLVPANHLENENVKGKTPSVHYKKSTGNPPGFSLGGWAPVDGPDGRPGVPVFTVEPDMDFESWAFLDGVQYMTSRGKDMVRQPYTAKQIRPLRYIEARATSLRAYANAVIDIGLG